MKYKFSDLVTFARTGLNPRKNFILQSSGNPYVTIKNIRNGKLIIDNNTDFVDDEAIKLIHKRSKIKKGDILFASIGRIGDMYIIENDPIGWDINESVFAFTLNTSIIRQKYFYYLFRSRDVRDYLAINSSGSTFTSIKMNQLQKMEFNIPSLEEQDAIIEILSNIDKLIESKSKRIEYYNELLKSKFSEAFAMDNYTKAAFIDCVEFLRNGANIKQDKRASGIPITRIETLANDRFNYDRLGYANIFSTKQYERYILNDGDLLISHINSIEYVGRTVQYTKIDDNPIIHGMNLLCARLKKGFNPYFIEEYFKTDEVKTYIQSIAKKAVNQASITVNNLGQLPIPLVPIDEQNKFAEFVKQINKSKTVLNKQLKTVNELFESKMSEFFTNKED